MRIIMTSLTALAVIVCSGGSESANNDDGALYLTPLLRAGRMDEARAASKVKLTEQPAVESYSGYLNVDEVHGSNLFFWFFPAVNDAANAPVVLWLQGGPGVSSLFGLFFLNGPFSVIDEREIKLRDSTWTSTHSMLYVDSPVGAGYSFTGNETGYSSDQTAASQNLYNALVQFFTLFPEYRKNDFFVTGESYAGKFVPSVSHAIHRNNAEASVKINLKGLAIGNGLIDPINQIEFSEFLYQNGFLDDDGKREFEEHENEVRARIVSGDFKAASLAFDKMFKCNFYPYPSVFQNLTGLRYYYNMLSNTEPPSYNEWEKYIQRPSVRVALHVGRRSLENGSAARRHMLDDMMRSVSSKLSELLDAGRYRVLLYSGLLDIKTPYRSTMRVARSLRWSGAEEFRNAKRTVWCVQSRHNNDITDMAGYATTFGPLTVLSVRNAGHLVPNDQPIWGLEIINRFTSGKTF